MKTKPETDNQLLARYKEIATHKAAKGESFDLEHELCTAMARRDYKIAEKKFRRQVITGQVVHYLIQLALLFFIYANWDDLKIVVVLLLVMLWRSISYHSLEIKRLSVRAIELFAFAHPTAKDDFFRSEHCYDTPVEDRIFDLLNKQRA